VDYEKDTFTDQFYADRARMLTFDGVGMRGQ
jgi:hypothetical protein